ncbi:MAG: nitroreductase [Clostridium sp.]|jgi:nitroreductase
MNPVDSIPRISWGKYFEESGKIKLPLSVQAHHAFCRIEADANVSLNEDSPQEELKQIIRDTSISIGYILLEAYNLGLGTCWVAWFTQEEIRPILNIPADKYVVGIITLGYANETPKGERNLKN